MWRRVLPVVALMLVRAGAGDRAAVDDAPPTRDGHHGDAESCEDWRCAVEGQFCPFGAAGSGRGGYCCRGGEWVRGSCDVAEAALPAAFVQALREAEEEQETSLAALQGVVYRLHAAFAACAHCRMPYDHELWPARGRWPLQSAWNEGFLPPCSGSYGHAAVSCMGGHARRNGVVEMLQHFDHYPERHALEQAMKRVLLLAPRPPPADRAPATGQSTARRRPQLYVNRTSGRVAARARPMRALWVGVGWQTLRYEHLVRQWRPGLVWLTVDSDRIKASLFGAQATGHALEADISKLDAQLETGVLSPALSPASLDAIFCYGVFVPEGTSRCSAHALGNCHPACLSRTSASCLASRAYCAVWPYSADFLVSAMAGFRRALRPGGRLLLHLQASGWADEGDCHGKLTQQEPELCELYFHGLVLIERLLLLPPTAMDPSKRTGRPTATPELFVLQKISQVSATPDQGGGARVTPGQGGQQALPAPTLLTARAHVKEAAAQFRQRRAGRFA